MRYWYGGTHADWVMTPGNQTGEDSPVQGYQPVMVPGQTVTLWDAPTGGTQYTDLLDADGNPISQVTADEYGSIPPFQGPDGVTYLWASASEDGSEPRYLMASPTLGDALAALEARLGETWVFSAPTDDAEGAVLFRKYNDTGAPLTLQWVRASAGTAPTGGDTTVDVLLNGSTSVFSAPPTINNGQHTTGRVTTFLTSTIENGEYITVDVSGEAGATAITVEIRVR